MSFDDILRIPPYSLCKEENEPLLTARLLELTEHHRAHCLEYRRILDSVGYDREQVSGYEVLSFLPVRLFKELNLKSVP